MQLYTKELLIATLEAIRDRGWIANARPGNVGGIGNTLEDLLGIQENNLPIPNAAEWELKTIRKNTNSLTTLFHLEPSPRAVKIVSELLLPSFGWRHQQAGKKYSEGERSFRQTIRTNAYSDRGFKVVVNRDKKRVEIAFDANAISDKHLKWRNTLPLDGLDPIPYWGFQDLTHKAGTKLTNMFYIQAESRKVEGQEFFHYNTLIMLKEFNPDYFIDALEEGLIYVDFDARTGHNHGTKFRTRVNVFPRFYTEVEQLF